jgi:hypothetical protein
MLNALALGGVALSFLAPPTITSTQAPPDGSISVQIATANGSGCRPGTTAVALDPANSFFTITYNDFVAQVGVGARPVDSRKNCQISVVVHVPQGFTYAIAKTDYRGFANLQSGAYGIERANYYFQGMSATGISSHQFNGPYERGWQATDNVGIAAVVYRPCGENRNFNINTEVQVSPGTSDPHVTNSYMTMDSTDGDFETIYHFAWKRC